MKIIPENKSLIELIRHINSLFSEQGREIEQIKNQGGTSRVTVNVLRSTAPKSISTTPKAGTQLEASRVDHVHVHPTFTTGDLHSEYIQASGGRAFTGNQSMGGFKLANVADPTANADAANKGYVDNYVNNQAFFWGLVLG